MFRKCVSVTANSVTSLIYKKVRTFNKSSSKLIKLVPPGYATELVPTWEDTLASSQLRFASRRRNHKYQHTNKCSGMDAQYNKRNTHEGWNSYYEDHSNNGRHDKVGDESKYRCTCSDGWLSKFSQAPRWSPVSGLINEGLLLQNLAWCTTGTIRFCCRASAGDILEPGGD